MQVIIQSHFVLETGQSTIIFRNDADISLSVLLVSSIRYSGRETMLIRSCMLPCKNSFLLSAERKTYFNYKLLYVVCVNYQKLNDGQAINLFNLQWLT